MEKKITDLLDCIQDDTVRLHIKDVASIEKIQEATMKKIRDRNNNGVKKKVRKMSSMVAVSAVFVLLFSVTALAVVSFTVYENPSAMLCAFFGERGTISSDGVVDIGERPEDFRFNLPGWNRIPVDKTLADELIANYISAETATISWDRYILTVEANLYDSLTNSGILYYTVENPEGVSGYEIWPNGTLWFNPETISFFPHSNWYGTSYINEAMSTEQKLYICEYYTRPATDMKLEIQVWSYDEAKYKGSKTLNLLSGVEMSNLNLSDGNVIISPIAMKLDAVALDFDVSTAAPDNICFKYVDGSEYIVKNSEAFISNQSYSSIDGHLKTILFNRIVDINNLAEIVMDDVIIKIN